MERDTAPVRPGEELDLGALTAYLRGKLPEGELSLEQFPGGHSNLTYLLRAGGREYVLRRPPLGPVAPKAHDMAREFHVLQKVHAVFPPAPAVYVLCEDLSVIGSVFYVMERRSGVILRDRLPSGWNDTPGLVSQAFLECLVKLHAIDIVAHGLASLGKPEGFLERQVRGWADRWHRAKTEEMPEIENAILWLAERMPASGKPSLVHNDFKLDNIMLHPQDPRRIEAVLDWEMTTVGDPLADLGLTLCYWTLGATSEGGAALSTGPGWYSRDEFVARYAERSGRDLSRIRYYEVLGIFKLAVILQQIYVRYVRGQTRDERFRTFDRRVRALARFAAAHVEKEG